VLVLKVSVIIPVFNCETYVEDCLSSVTGQSEGDIEIIVVDDGSTDRSLNRVKQAASRDTRIRVFAQPRSGYPAIARNFGLSKATGRLIAFLDADDVYHPDKIKKAVSVFKAFPAVDLVSHDWKFIYSERQHSESDSHFSRSGLIRGAADYLEDCDKNVYVCRADFYTFASVRFSPFHTSSIMFRSELLDSTSTWFRKEMHPREDVEFWLRLTKNRRVALVNEVLSYYRKIPGSLTSDAALYLLGGIRAHTENLKLGMDVFGPRDVRIYRSKIATLLHRLGYAYSCNFDGSRARSAYRRSMGIEFRAKTLTDYFKTFLPEPVVKAYRGWTGQMGCN
jgi:glycosyltransferase involved in cell wall biosynthesis